MRDIIKYKLFGGGGGAGGSQADWDQNDATAPDYVKNRPFYRKNDFVHANEHFFGTTAFPYSLTTAKEYGVFFASAPWQGSEFYISNKIEYAVVVNNREYICTAKINEFGQRYLGADMVSFDNGEYDFSSFPFYLDGGAFITQSPGEYTVDFYVVSQGIELNFGPKVRVPTEFDESGNEIIHAKKLELVKKAYNMGYPAFIVCNEGDLLVTDVVEGGFITASCVTTHTRNYMVNTVVKTFLSSTGQLNKSVTSVQGRIEENGIGYPVICIGTSLYKISVSGSDLVATKL